MKVASRGNRVVESEKTRREKWKGKALDDDSVGNVCSSLHRRRDKERLRKKICSRISRQICKNLNLAFAKKRVDLFICLPCFY